MNSNDNQPCKSHPMPGKSARFGYLLVAYAATGLGIAGVFLPILPATPFLLVAVWAGSRGSQRVHDWIYDQPQFARLIDDWQEQGAVPLSAKWLATAMMTVSWFTLIIIDSHWMIVTLLSFFFFSLNSPDRL